MRLNSQPPTQCNLKPSHHYSQMSFFDKFKRTMGFPSMDEEEIEEGIDATVTPLRERQQRAGEPEVAPEVAPTPVAPAPTVAEEAAARAEAMPRPQPEVIFSRVVEIFNEALPGFLQKSVDPEKQRQLLYSSLDTSIRNYFEELERMVERRHEARFQADRLRLQEQIDALRLKAQKEEELNSDAKTRQLSAERQKRALSERVHDLEKRISEIEAENEQYILENKTMANKIRLLGMTDADAEELRKDTLAKTEELRQKQEEVAAIIADAEKKQAEAERKQAEAESIIGEAVKEKEQLALQLEEAQSRIAALDDENRRMSEAMEQSKAKDEISMAMVNDLNARAARARKDVEEKEAAATAATAAATAAANALEASQRELAESKQALAESQKALAEKDNALIETEARAQASATRLAKALDDLKVVKSVQEQIVKLEEQQRVSDGQLRKTRDELMEKKEMLEAREADILSKNTTLRIKDDTIRRLEDQSDRLRQTIETLQYEKAEQESAMRQEIERLKSLSRFAPAAAVAAATPAVTQPTSVREEPAVTEDRFEEMPVAKETNDSFAQTDEPKVELLFEESIPEPAASQAEPEKPRSRRGRPRKSDRPIPETPEEAAALEAGSQTDDSLFPTVEEVRKSAAAATDDDDDFMLLDTTDWLISSDADEPKRRQKRSKKSQSSDNTDDNFGYREPARAEHPDNPAQMSLF